jgi:very-short-patch-repair endonuclease
MSNSRPMHHAPKLAVLELAAAQWGVVHAAQAIELGLSSHSIYRLTKRGEWTRVFKQVFAAGPHTLSWQQLAMAACLWAPGDAASHRCAAALWELDGIEPGIVEIVRLRKKASPGRNVIVHPTSTPFSVHRRHGIPTTSAARTLIDLAAVVDDDSLELALESGLRSRITAIPRLQRALAEEGGRGRPGSERLGRLLAHHQSMPTATESALEAKVARLLRTNGFPPAKRQFVVRDAEEFVARLDFAYPQAMVAIEADGYRWHSGRAAWSRERTRLTRLAALGWRILFVTSADANAGASEMIDALRARLGPTTIPL